MADAARRRSRSVAGDAVASVRTIESIVAILGWIIPTPLAMPVTVTATVPAPDAAGSVDPGRGHLRRRVGRPERDRGGGERLVGRGEAAGGDARDLGGHLVHGEPDADDPGREVEDVLGGACPGPPATASPIAAWSASPAGPVAALALPEVAITALA